MDTITRYATVAVFMGTFGVASSSSAPSSSSTHSSWSRSTSFGFVTTLGVLRHEHHNPHRARS